MTSAHAPWPRAPSLEALAEGSDILVVACRATAETVGLISADIIDAVEGPVALTECASHDNHCGLESSCRVGASWQRVSVAIRAALAEVTLTQLTGTTPLAEQPLHLNVGAVAPIVWRARA